jgi:hypothetical protein
MFLRGKLPVKHGPQSPTPHFARAMHTDTKSPVYSFGTGKREPNWIANWLIAVVIQMLRRQRMLAFLIAR